MSISNVKKLEIGMELSCHFDSLFPKKDLTEKNIQEFINVGGLLEEAALASGELDVLERSFDYFLEEDNDAALMNGGCESLEGEIEANFSVEQLLEVLYKKFENLLSKNMRRSIHFAQWFLNLEHPEYFAEFRKMFNTIKASQSEQFLRKLSEMTNYELGQEQIKLLREDMKKW